MPFRKTAWLACAVLLVALTVFTAIPAAASVRLGGVVISGGYVSGPVFYPYPYWYPGYYAFGPYYGWPWAFNDPFWNVGAAYGPTTPRAGTGKVVLQNAATDAKVYINDAYAGVAGELKSLHLEPGVYELEVRGPQATFHERIYVLTGKTLKLDVRSEKDVRSEENVRSEKP